MKKKLNIFVLLVFVIYILLSVFVFANVKVEYQAPEIYINEWWSQNLKNISNSTIADDWSSVNNDTNSSNIIKFSTNVAEIIANINFMWFANWSNPQDLYGYLWKNWLANYDYIQPADFKYDGYYYWLLNNKDKISLNFQKIDYWNGFNKRWISLKFRNKENYKSNDGNVNINIKNINNDIKIKLNQSNTSIIINWKNFNKNIDIENNLWPNWFRWSSITNNVPQNFQLNIFDIKNNDWKIDTRIQITPLDNKNIIVYNWPWSLYPLVYRPHVGNTLNNSHWYFHPGYLYRFSNNSWKDSWNISRTTWYQSTNPFKEPKLVAKLYWYNNLDWMSIDRTDYYLPIGIKNGIIIMDVYPTENHFHFWLVTLENTQRRFDWFMANNSIQWSNSGDWHYPAKYIHHGYNEWYRAYFKIKTRNWKQELETSLYWWDRNNKVRVYEGSYRHVFDGEQFHWKPNFFLYKNTTAYIGPIIIIPEDDVFKVWKPWWFIKQYNNINWLPNTIEQYIWFINNNGNDANYLWTAVYWYPIFGFRWTFGSNWLVNNRIDGWNKGDLLNINKNDNYLTIIKWFFKAKEDGQYCFAVDGDDSVAILIDWQTVTSWLGPHGFSKNLEHHWCINLKKGFHKFLALQIENFGGDNFIFYVKWPQDSNYHVIDPLKGEIYAVIYDETWIPQFADAYIDILIKNQNLSSNYYKIDFNNEFLWITNIKDIINKKIWYSSLEDLINYAYNLAFNKGYSIYGDDLIQDIWPFNTNFWFKDKPVYYRYLWWINRLGFWFNIYIINWWSEPPSPTYSETAKSYWFNYIYDDLKFIKYIYNHSRWFIPEGLSFDRSSWTLNRSQLIVALKQFYNINNKIFFNEISTTHYNSGDFDYNLKYNNKWLLGWVSSSNDSNRAHEGRFFVFENKHDIVKSEKYATTYNNLIYNYITKILRNKNINWLINSNTFDIEKEISPIEYLHLQIDKDSSGWHGSFVSNFSVFDISINKLIQKNGLLWITKPAISCKQLYKTNPYLANDYYLIKLDNNHTYKLYCDFRKPFNGVTEYVRLYGDYDKNSAYSCWAWNYILNDYIECYNPNRYTDIIKQIDNLYITSNPNWYWIYWLHDKNKSFNTETVSLDWRHWLWHSEWMTIMKRWSKPTSSDWQYIRLGINYTHNYYNNQEQSNSGKRWTRQIWWFYKNTRKYMNYSTYGRYWPTPGNREDHLRRQVWMWWKEP